MGRLSLKVRRWLTDRPATIEDPPPGGDACLQASEVDPDDPTAAEIAAAVEKNRHARTQHVLGALGLGALIYVAWSFALGSIELMRRGEVEGTGPWESFPASGWGLGLSTQLADTFVFAALALVAALTIASATSRAPAHGADANVIAGWAGWLATLALVSVMTSAAGFAVAVSQVAARPRSSALLVFIALLTCWLSSGIQTQADERLDEAHHQTAMQNLSAVRQRIKDKLPQITSRSLRGLTFPALFTPLLVGLASTLTFGLTGLLLRSAPAGTVLQAWWQWLVIVTLCAAIPLWAAAFCWSIRVQGAKRASTITGTLVVVIMALEAWFLVVLVLNASGTLTPTLWIALAVWLILTAGLCLVPQRNPITQLLILTDWIGSTKRLNALETEMTKRKKRTRRPCQCC